MSCDDGAVKHELHEETPGSYELKNVDGCRVCGYITQMRRRKLDEMVIEYENLLDMGSVRRMNKEDITIDTLRWRIKKLLKRGPRARGLWTPRMVARSISSADASASTPGSDAAPMLPFVAATCEFDPGSCLTELCLKEPLPVFKEAPRFE